MVERLKFAIEKARAERESFARAGDASIAAAAVPRQAAPGAGRASAPPTPGPAAESLLEWSVFEAITPDQKRLDSARVVTRDKRDPAFRAFDMLRTRTMHACRERNWSRIAVTSATKGVGKTVVSLNLAFSLARQPATRVLLLDLDLLQPHLTQVLAPESDAEIGEFLAGATPAESYLRRCGSNLLVGLNRAPVANSSEVLQTETAARVLADTIERTRPTVVIYDTSPVMVSDDALSVMANSDCAMLVVGAGESKANEITEGEKLISEWTNLLGIVLNKSDEPGREAYAY